MRTRKRNGNLLTTSEVAHILRIHINTTRRWSNRDVLWSGCIGSCHDRRFRHEDIMGILIDLRTSLDGETKKEKWRSKNCHYGRQPVDIDTSFPLQYNQDLYQKLASRLIHMRVWCSTY